MTDHEPGPEREPAGARLPEGAVPVRLRRAPRYRAFVATGAVLGAVAGLVLGANSSGDTASFSVPTLLGYFGALGVLLGAVLGGGAAVLAERRRR